MTARRLYSDPISGKVGFYIEADGGGDPFDPSSPCNVPLLDPANHLDKVKAHSDLDHFEVAAAGTATIHYPAIASTGADTYSSAAYATLTGSPTDDLLCTHDLGYEPFALVAIGRNILWPGMPIIAFSDGTARYATAYVTATELRIATQTTAGAIGLPDFPLGFSFLVFKQPTAVDGSGILFDRDPITDIVRMAQGKINSSRPYLQVVPGGSPLGLIGGRSIDLSGGSPRAFNADLTYYEPVPSALAFFLPELNYNGVGSAGPSGSSLGYSGSYAGPDVAIEVQAP